MDTPERYDPDKWWSIRDIVAALDARGQPTFYSTIASHVTRKKGHLHAAARKIGSPEFGYRWIVAADAAREFVRTYKPYGRRPQ